MQQGLGMLNHRIFITIITVVLAIGVMLYIVQSTAKNNVQNVENIESKQAPHEDIEQNISPFSGKIIELNTNANKITFIKIKDNNSQKDILFMSKLDHKDLNLNLGDVVEFTKDLPVSTNGNYFMINSTVDFKVVQKNTANVIKVDDIIPLDSINEDLQGIEVTTSGKISDLYSSNKGHNFFKIYNNNKAIKGVLFAAESDELKGRQNLLKKVNATNTIVKVKGKVTIYKGELEIIVSKIWN